MAEFDHLLQQFLSDALSPAELQDFMQQVQGAEQQEQLQLQLAARMEAPVYTDLTEGVDADKLFALAMQKGVEQTVLQQPVRVIRPVRWIAAAAILLLVVTGAYLWFDGERGQHAPAGQPVADILPGKGGAILTLSNGNQVVLDSLGNGLVADEAGARVVLKSGALAYDAATAKGEVVYHTLTTPRGRQFNVVLPDGTNVWLNSGSSIRYPTVFASGERKVMVTGEVYFEVAADKAKPFKVQATDRNSIEVLGTRFNINAYDDEAVVRTTLLDGAVRVAVKNSAQDRSAAHSVVLKPGQQSRVKAGAVTIQTAMVDVDKVMAWRRGFFNFEDAGLDEVMRQLARWYDLEVVYETTVPPIVFGGELSRNINLSGVLKALDDSKVHYKIEGKKITVLP